MKSIPALKLILLFALSSPVLSFAQSARYEVKITNGSRMPLSPGLVYSKTGATPANPVGSISSVGFTQLCQMGQVNNRFAELKADSRVKTVATTAGPILPGESKTFEILVPDVKSQSLQFETMYGKSKDVCGVVSVNSHSLLALLQHVTPEYVGRDAVVLSGAFDEPALPSGMSYLDPDFCNEAKDAISCLRELSKPSTKTPQIRLFSGYFPSLVTALEMKYGAMDTQTLAIPTSGAIEVLVKLKH